jgi:hypothetical protein
VRDLVVASGAVKLVGANGDMGAGHYYFRDGL